MQLHRIAAPAAMILAMATPAVLADDTDPPLTADRLIAVVLEQNPNLAAIEEAAIAASFRADAAGPLPDPVVSYGIAPNTLGERGRDDGQRIELMQAIPWPGELRTRRQAARSEALAADEAADLRRLNVIAATKELFAEWYFVHEALRLNGEHLVILASLRAAAESGYAAGRVGRQDFLQAQVEIALLEDRLLRLEQQRTGRRAQLNALMGRDPGIDVAPPIGLPNVVPPQSVEELIAIAEAQHPELKRLQFLVDAREANTRYATIDRLPDLRLSAGYNSLWDAPRKRFTVGATLTIPLDQGRRGAAVSAARADQRRAEWTLRDRRTTLLGELTEAHAEALRADASLALQRDRLVPTAEASFEAAINEYQSGVADFLNVVAAERNLLAARLALVRAEADLYRSLADLEYRFGGPLPTTTATIIWESAPTFSREDNDHD